MPCIKIQNEELIFTQYGYYDTLCYLIGKRVLFAYENENRIIIRFENDTELIISLNEEDRQCAEAIMIQMHEGEWEIW